MANIVVHMKEDSQSTGRKHEHNDVIVTECEHHLRVYYRKSKLIINYPYTSIEKWEET